MFKDPARWESIRAKGRARFVVTFGVLMWGLPMCLVMTAFVNPPSPHGLLSPRNYLIFSVILWCTIGALFGALAWNLSERAYKRRMTAAADNAQTPRI